MISQPSHRYAIYYAPQVDSVEWVLASQWLGRCAVDGESRIQPTLPGIPSQQFAALTAAPRRYGWHATLKAPFTLMSGTTELELYAGIEALASSLEAFERPKLAVTILDNFLALVPADESGPLNALADTCVTKLHHFAQPLNERELARRRAAGLTARQNELLQAWGYPFVLDEFRFHCSLTGRLEDLMQDQLATLQAAATSRFADLPVDKVNSIALFCEPTPGADFRLLQHFPLGGQACA
jgi:putative phosphonate metabolism protein